MFKKVLIPVDVEVPKETQKLLSAARTLTENWNSELHVVTVVPNVGMAIVGTYLDENFETNSRKTAAAELAQAVAAAGLNAQQHVLSGTIYDRVIAVAAKLDVDLIVIGAHRPDLKDYLIGSNAARVVRHSKQSVLVIRD